MNLSPHIQSKRLVILSLSDKDRRRTSTSALRTKFDRSALATPASALPDLCYLLSDRLFPIPKYC
jgi:hypothetical protein